MKYQQKGFALLYAILLTGAILSVGVILMNIITKQLLFSSINRNSEISYYYAANSGRECLQYHARENFDKFYEYSDNRIEFKTQATINCFGNKNINMINVLGSGDIVSYTGNLVLADGTKIDLTIKFNKSCLVYPRLNTCDTNNNGDLFKNVEYVVQADGYNASAGDRVAKRTAVLVSRLF